MKRLFNLTTRSKKSGFTLIELLVVIAIIGVLASVVLASLNNARRKSRDARRIADIKQIQLALTLYYDSVGAQTYPPDTDLSPLSANGYIAAVPTDPLTLVAYPYQALTSSDDLTACSSGCMYYHLGANLEEDATSGQTGGNIGLVNDRDLDPAGLWLGMSADCSTTAGATEDGCYDLTP